MLGRLLFVGVTGTGVPGVHFLNEVSPPFFLVRFSKSPCWLPWGCVFEQFVSVGFLCVGELNGFFYAPSTPKVVFLLTEHGFLWGCVSSGIETCSPPSLPPDCFSVCFTRGLVVVPQGVPGLCCGCLCLFFVFFAIEEAAMFGCFGRLVQPGDSTYPLEFYFFVLLYYVKLVVV